MKLPHKAHVALVDGETFVIMRNKGQPFEPSLETVEKPDRKAPRRRDRQDDARRDQPPHRGSDRRRLTPFIADEHQLVASPLFAGIRTR